MKKEKKKMKEQLNERMFVAIDNNDIKKLYYEIGKLTYAESLNGC